MTGTGDLNISRSPAGHIFTHLLSAPIASKIIARECRFLVLFDAVKLSHNKRIDPVLVPGSNLSAKSLLFYSPFVQRECVIEELLAGGGAGHFLKLVELLYLS